MHVLSQSSKGDQDIVHFELLIRTGVIDEPVHNYGIAHMVEHLIAKRVLGAVRGLGWVESYVSESFEASTHAQYTRYAWSCDRLDHESLNNIMRGIFAPLGIPSEDFDAERGVVEQEVRELRDSPEFEVHSAYLHSRYGTSSLGQFAYIDSGVDYESTVAFASHNYDPRNSILAVSCHDEAILRLFGSYASVAANSTAFPSTVPPVSELDVQICIPGKGEAGAIGLYWLVPAHGLEDILQHDAVADIMQAYLTTHLRDKGLIYHVDVSSEVFPSLATIELVTNCDENDVRRTTRELIHALNQLPASLTTNIVDYYLTNKQRSLRLEKQYPRAEVETLAWYYMFTGKCITLDDLHEQYGQMKHRDITERLQRILSSPRIEITQGR